MGASLSRYGFADRVRAAVFVLISDRVPCGDDDTPGGGDHPRLGNLHLCSARSEADRSRWKIDKPGIFFSSRFLVLLGFFVYLLFSDIRQKNARLPEHGSEAPTLVKAAMMVVAYRCPSYEPGLALQFAPQMRHPL